jgi:DNA-binding response OmpR family regulator
MPLDKIAAYAALSPSERTIFEYLAPRIGEYVPTERIVGDLYDYRSDGGPENATGVIYVLLHKLRTKIQPYGLDIKGHPSRGEGGGRTRLYWVFDNPEVID